MKGSQTTNQQEITLDYLFQLTMKKKWDEVIEIYKNHSWAQSAKLTKSEETALHVSVSSYNSETISSYGGYNEIMINSIPERDVFRILSMQNDKGNTPLHLAAAVGWVAICECIASKDRNLISIRNTENETPLFVAAHHGKMEAFLCLHEMYNKDKAGQEADESLCRRKDGNTILHSAISGEYFRLAYLIISYYPKLVNSVNEEGETPLHVLARKPNVFKSSSHLGHYDSLIYHCVFVDELKKPKYVPGAYQNNPEEDEKDVACYPANYATCILLLKFAMKVVLTVLGVGFNRIKTIQEKKQRYLHAFQIMNQMIESESSYKYDSNGEKPVQKLEPLYSGRVTPPATPPDPDNPEDTHRINTESDNGMALLDEAHQNKDHKEKDQSLSGPGLQCQECFATRSLKPQTSVLDYLLKMKLPEYLFHQVDDQGNSILHLAAMLRDYQPWRIPVLPCRCNGKLSGTSDCNSESNQITKNVFIQMQHVKHSIPPLCFAHNNKEGHTPRQIFTKTHKSLVKEGTDWLIKTSESCSLIAALIATVAFATSATVPGGLNDRTGYPNMQNHTAFDLFSISSLIALCLSVTALVFFLAIITSRCEEHDFKTNLPRKLLMGLTSLFASIAAMLVSFCAGHTFILRDKLRLAAVPIYAIACVPVTFFAVAQLPLYFDLLWAACRKVPLRSYKVFYH
ncbi:hypothetical protein DH2020_043520 [Rehmannia glutinosa]|uniref:PGG domain-containing protein n=1 Tax=Rehmannia glutinosa TaxID=99300 RepID=A0ABR0UKN2_REHGL